MDRIERKARELMRDRKNRICITCKNKGANGCEVTPDAQSCIYNDYELWKPNSKVFFKLAARDLEEFHA